MFGSGVLEIAIGMLFIYLLLSTISSALNEWIGGLTASRSRSLEAGIRSLLNDPKGEGLARKVLDHPLVRSLESPGQFSIPGLLGRWWQKFQRPHYLSSDLFVTAILDQIAPLGKDSPARTFADIWNRLHDKLDEQTVRRDALQKSADELKKEAAVLKGDEKKKKVNEAAAREADAEQADALVKAWKTLLAVTGSVVSNDLEALRKSLADWYDESMERVSGWYKRKTQLMLLLIGAVLSVAINADGVMYLQFLNQESTARDAVAAAARDFVTVPSNDPRNAPPQTAPTAANAADIMTNDQNRVQAIIKQLRSYSLPIGWDLSQFTWNDLWASFTRDQAPQPAAAAASPVGSVAQYRGVPRTRRDWFFKGLGLLFSTIAISMGATFYFDLLKQLVNIRQTGVPPDERPKPRSDEGPKPQS